MTSENATEGYNSNMKELQDMAGKLGTAVTDLRPVGKVDIDGEWFDAQTEAEYVLKGEQVVVLEAKNSFVIVRKK
jgi:membrane-bound serine protease (ClpP class)